MKIHFGENGTPPLHIPIKTMLKQVISAGLRLHMNKARLHAHFVQTNSPAENKAASPTSSTYCQQQVESPPLAFDYGKLNCEVNLTLVSPLEITQLNMQYRSINSPTDVLSFPSLDAKPIPGNRRKKPILNLGDIVICLQIAQQQALEYGHALERELAFLTAHGLLHLLGYDHTTPEDEEVMFAAQKEILTRLGILR